MALTNYTELQTSIAIWLKRNDLTAYIPDFITLAESYINNDLRARSMKTEATVTVSTSDKFVDLPTGFIECIALLDSDGDPLEQIHYDKIKGMDISAGEPEKFAVTSKIYFDRVGSSALSFTMLYYKALDISADSTNDVLTNYPHIYLYGSLLQAETFIKNDKRLSMWQALYENAMRKANERNVDNLVKLQTDHPSVYSGFDINEG